MHNNLKIYNRNMPLNENGVRGIVCVSDSILGQALSVALIYRWALDIAMREYPLSSDILQYCSSTQKRMKGARAEEIE